MNPQPLVLLPGLMSDAAVWQAQIDHLSEHHAIQVMEYGLLDSLPAMAAKVVARAPERFALAGHSMGGRIALEIMRRAPHRVAALALLDTGCHALAPGPAGDAERNERRRLLQRAREQGVRAMGADWVLHMVHSSRHGDAELISSIVDMFARKPLAVFEAQIRALLARPEAYPLLASIRCPTLVLAGQHDVLSPPARNEEMSAAIESSRLVILPDCGHMAPQEKPQEVNHHLDEWLSLAGRTPTVA